MSARAAVASPAPRAAAVAPVRLGGTHDPAEKRAEASATALLAAAPAPPSSPAAPAPPSLPGAGAPGLPFAGGQPLAASERAYFEPRLRRSLGDVRVHRGAVAGLAARAIGARGFTHGREIVLAYPEQDRSTLAHELAHVADGETGVIRRRELSRDAVSRDLVPSEIAAQSDTESQALYNYLTSLAQTGYLDDPAFAANYGLVRADIERRHHIGAAPPKPAEPKSVPVPGISGRDSAATLVSIMHAIAGIQQIASDGTSEIDWEGRRQVVSGTGAAAIRRTAVLQLSDGLSGAVRLASSALGLYDRQSEADKKSWFVAPIIKTIGQIKDPGPLLRGLALTAEAQGTQARALVAAGDLIGAARLLASAETSARQANALAYTYWDSIIETGEITQTVLEYTRDISLGIAVTIAAVLAAPVVAGVVAGAGLTGGLATGVSIVATGAVVGTGNAAVRGLAGAGGAALAGEGGSASEVFDAFKKDGKEGAIDGFLAGAGGSAARALGPALGIGGKAGSQFLRRAAAQAIVNSGSAMVDAMLHGASVTEAAKRGAIAAVVSLPGAAAGGVKNRLAQAIAAPLIAGGTAYAGAVASGASPDEARRAATVAMTSALIVGRAASADDAALEARGRAIGKNARNTAAAFGGAVLIGTATGLEGASSTGGGGPAVTQIAGGQTTVAEAPASPKPRAPVTTANGTAASDATQAAVPVQAPATVAPAVVASAAATPVLPTGIAQPPLVKVPILPSTATATAVPTPATTAATASTAGSTPAAPATAAAGAAAAATPAPGVAQGPNVEAELGIATPQRAAIKGAFAGNLTNGANAPLEAGWRQTANPGEAASLTLANSRGRFDNQRKRFWRWCRGDARALTYLRSIGASFPEERNGGALDTSKTTVPEIILANGTALQVTLDHEVERQTDPTKALDPGNLRLSTRRDNTVVLRQLHDQDPFNNPPPGWVPTPPGGPP